MKFFFLLLFWLFSTDASHVIAAPLEQHRLSELQSEYEKGQKLGRYGAFVAELKDRLSTTTDLKEAARLATLIRAYIHGQILAFDHAKPLNKADHFQVLQAHAIVTAFLTLSPFGTDRYREDTLRFVQHDVRGRYAQELTIVADAVQAALWAGQAGTPEHVRKEVFLRWMNPAYQQGGAMDVSGALGNWTYNNHKEAKVLVSEVLQEKQGLLTGLPSHLIKKQAECMQHVCGTSKMSDNDTQLINVEGDGQCGFFAIGNPYFRTSDDDTTANQVRQKFLDGFNRALYDPQLFGMLTVFCGASSWQEPEAACLKYEKAIQEAPTCKALEQEQQVATTNLYLKEIAMLRSKLAVDGAQALDSLVQQALQEHNAENQNKALDSIIHQIKNQIKVSLAIGLEANFDKKFGQNFQALFLLKANELLEKEEQAFISNKLRYTSLEKEDSTTISAEQEFVEKLDENVQNLQSGRFLPLFENITKNTLIDILRGWEPRLISPEEMASFANNDAVNAAIPHMLRDKEFAKWVARTFMPDGCALPSVKESVSRAIATAVFDRWTREVFKKKVEETEESKKAIDLQNQKDALKAELLQQLLFSEAFFSHVPLDLKKRVIQTSQELAKDILSQGGGYLEISPGVNVHVLNVQDPSLETIVAYLNDVSLDVFCSENLKRNYEPIYGDFFAHQPKKGAYYLVKSLPHHGYRYSSVMSSGGGGDSISGHFQFVATKDSDPILLANILRNSAKKSWWKMTTPSPKEMNEKWNLVSSALWHSQNNVPTGNKAMLQAWMAHYVE